MALQIKMVVEGILFTSEPMVSLSSAELGREIIQASVDVDRIWITNEETGYFNG